VKGRQGVAGRKDVATRVISIAASEARPLKVFSS